MDRDAALRKWRTLQQMTVARGCTRPEAATAAGLAAQLAAKWGFRGGDLLGPGGARPSWDARAYARTERDAARRWHWEYRTCGKPRCRCFHGHKHGPYKYGKRRTGHTVRSIYFGKG